MVDGPNENNGKIQNFEYRDALAIGWKIFWQGVGSFLVALVAANLLVLDYLPELTRTGPSWLALAVPLLAAAGLSLFVFMPLLVRALVTRPCGRFRLEVIRQK